RLSLFLDLSLYTQPALQHSILFISSIKDTATTEIYTLSLHDALPISARGRDRSAARRGRDRPRPGIRARDDGSRAAGGGRTGSARRTGGGGPALDRGPGDDEARRRASCAAVDQQREHPTVVVEARREREPDGRDVIDPATQRCRIEHGPPRRRPRTCGAEHVRRTLRRRRDPGQNGPRTVTAPAAGCGFVAHRLLRPGAGGTGCAGGGGRPRARGCEPPRGHGRADRTQASPRELLPVR